MHRPRNVMQKILDLVFPPCCAACHKSGYVLCSSCLAQILPLSMPFCQHCSAPLTPNGICKLCQFSPLHLTGLRTLGIYQEPLRSFIHALKYGGNTRLAEPLGYLLAQAYMYYGMRAEIIIPVPLHEERQRQRGYNHAYLLAEVCASHTGIPLYDDVLVRHRSTLAQVGLKGSERRQNVAGAFLCNPVFATGRLYGRTILIIDDVCTSGSTLEACAAPLFSAGAKAVWGLVLARPIS